jgi:dienelactone hydrolase
MTSLSLPGFDASSFTYRGTHGRTTRTVYRKGKGPAVIVMPEIPGITPEVRAFAERVADAGFTVFVASLFGTPGRPGRGLYPLQSMVKTCVSREFSVLAANASSPIVDWLRALCREAHAELGGKGVGAIGMCMTGNFALALMVDPVVQAPVLSQPSLPVGLTHEARAGLHLSPEDLEVVKARVQGGCPVLGMRFTGDPLVPRERFERLRAELGDGFEAIEIDSSRGNPDDIPPWAHSVVTSPLVDREGHPTQRAMARVISFFRERLCD